MEDRQGPEVVEVYPRSSAIPENVLRFYVYFSEPMAEGDFLANVRVVHAESGEVLSGVFFDDIYELWAPDRKRITLLVDPGRVKTGLVAHEALGRAFRAGQHYVLTIQTSARSIRGAPLRASFQKAFVATTESRSEVAPERWEVEARCDGDRSRVLVRFGAPVDHVAVDHFLRVLSPGSEPMPGRWALSSDDASAAWAPDRGGGALGCAHALAVNRRFEDLAGNNVNGAFDHAAGSLHHRREGGWETIPLDAWASSGPASTTATAAPGD